MPRSNLMWARTRARARAALLIVTLGVAAWAAACASDANRGFGAEDAGGASPVPPSSSSLPGTLGGADAAPETLHVVPSAPAIDVRIDDDQITSNPSVALVAHSASGAVVAARWSVDHGELGSIDASSGVFRASARQAGRVTVTAVAGHASVTTSITVRVHVTRNGRAQGDAGVPDGGAAGGIGGVGGEGPGGPVVDASLVDRLRKQENPLADLALSYPYDGTVWPRGLRAPLLQWSTAAVASAVRVRLTEDLFDCDGVYSVDGLADVARHRQPIDEAAWEMATLSNQGEPLHASVKLYVPATDAVYGPLTATWSVAPASLKGTIYYNSYDSRLVRSSGIGAVLALRVGDTAPRIAVPATASTCTGCHTMAERGGYLFAQDASYANGASYALPGGQLAGSHTKGGEDDRKFVWAGVYPDGAFALTSSRYGREHNGMDSGLFDRASGGRLPTLGLTGVVTSAVTPAFACDGRRVVFNFWEGPGIGGVTAGAGHSLAVMDFDCHAAAGSVACGAPPYAFSNLREIYRDPARYPGWPAFSPGLGHVVFHNTLRPGGGDGELSTWQGAQADVWLATLPTATAGATAAALRALNGVSPSGASYLPRSASHPADEILNYEPTVGPIGSGGYFWVVFTSRRAYGNVAAGDPYETGDGAHPIAKKLWVAAVDLDPKPGVDPSHPAFYLPGQELYAGNMRGFWAADPCAANGQGCATGDECCGGYCRAPHDGGAPVCADAPLGCALEFDTCAADGDCCDAPATVGCLNGRCARRAPR